MKTNKNIYKNTEYFNQAMNWYYDIYIFPLSAKSIIIIILLVISFCFSSLFITISHLLPLVRHKNYMLKVVDINANHINIFSAKKYKDHNKSIAYVFIEMYVLDREKYQYENLESQFEIIKNFSSDAEYNKFLSFMSINNNNSPILRYQKNAKRDITITNIEFLSKNRAIVSYRSLGSLQTGEIFEDMLWKADINFRMNDINSELEKLDFIIDNYDVQIVRNNQSRN